MFRTPKRLADGTVALALDCVPGTTYLIQASSNFVVWETISTTNVSSSPVSCTDTNAARVARRFYRASSAATP